VAPQNREQALRNSLAAAESARNVSKFRFALFQELFAQYYAGLLRFGRSGRMLPFIFILMVLMGGVIYMAIQQQNWRQGFRYLMLLLVLFFGIPGAGVILRAWLGASRAVKQMKDPRRVLQLFFRLGWEQHSSTVYMIAPSAASAHHVPTRQAMDLRWKRFVREAGKELETYVPDFYDDRAMEHAGIVWNATVRVQLKPLRQSADGVLARAEYRLQFPRLEASGNNLEHYRRADESPTILYEMQGTVAFVRTKSGAWLIAEGPVDPLELIHGPDPSAAFEDEMFG